MPISIRSILAFALAVPNLVWAAAPNMEAAFVPLEGDRIYLNAATVETREVENLKLTKPKAYKAGKAHIVQLDSPITPERRTAMESAGIVLFDYLPQNAYLADLTQAHPGLVEELSFVQWVGEYQPAWKIDPTIGKRLQPFQTPERIKVEDAGQTKLLVTLFPGYSIEEGMQLLAGLGAEVVDANEIGHQTVVDVIVGKSSEAWLAESDAVQYIEEAPELTLRNSTTRWIVQSNTAGVTPVHDQGIRGLGQIIGIIDGRVSVNHCSFSDTDPIGPLHRKIQAYNTTLGSDTHGTHVAGTAVGDAGTTGDTRGIAYEGRLCYNTIPAFNESAIVSRFNTHHSQGATIHTNSWGDDGTTAYNSLCRGIDVFSHSNEDDLVFFAVTNLSTLKNPENAKNLVAVGASRDTPQQHMHCSGGAGPTSDGRRKPEVYAPGCSTLSSTGAGCSTTSLTGTSMASPAVSGVAMLIRQYYMDGFYPSGAINPADAFTPTGALIKATLINASVDMTGISGFPSNQEGWGRVLADDALFFPGNIRKLVVLDDIRNADGFSTGMSASYPVLVLSSATSLKVTLVWTDPAAASGASQAAINNLDLKVTSPSSALYLGNVFSGGVSATGGTSDLKNNVEQVLLNAPETGNWTVEVVGAAVNSGTQGYSIIVTGDVATGPTCSDGLQNQGEDLVDCGGPCPVCQCLVDSECDDGDFCNGVEDCTEIGRCLNGPAPCQSISQPYCDEVNDSCHECLIDDHCSDQEWCTGTETCDGDGNCVAGQAPCTDPEFPYCNEVTEACDQCRNDLDCDDGDSCTTDVCNFDTILCEHTQLTIIYGDSNDDLEVDSDDLICALNGFIDMPFCPGADVEPCAGDGDIDVDDIISLLNTFSGDPPCADPCPAG